MPWTDVRWTEREPQATLRVLDAFHHGNRLDIASARARAEPRGRRLIGRGRSVLSAARRRDDHLPRLARPGRDLAGRDDRAAGARRQGRGPRRQRAVRAGRRAASPRPPPTAAPGSAPPPAATSRAAQGSRRPAPAGTNPPAAAPAPAPVAAPPAATAPAATAPASAPPAQQAPATQPAQPAPARQPGTVEQVVEDVRRTDDALPLPPVVREPVEPVLETVQQLGRTVDEVTGPLLPTLP